VGKFTLVVAALLGAALASCGAPSPETCESQLQALREAGQFGGTCATEEGRQQVATRYNKLPVGDATGSKPGWVDN